MITCTAHCYLYPCTTPAPPTPTEVTAWFMNTSSVRVAWRWTSSGPAPNCFNITRVTYRPEGGDESSLQLSDPAATAATLTDLQCNTRYTITVVATAGVHRRENMSIPKMVFVPPRGMYIDVLSCRGCGILYHCTISSSSHPHWSHCSVHEYLKCQGNMAVD